MWGGAYLLGLWGTFTGPALPATEPVEITATQGMSIDLDRRRGVAKGDVVIRRRDLLVCCDEAEASYSKQRVERVVCRGRVVVKRPNEARAIADTVTLDAAADVITLEGRARVYTSDAQLRGERMVYDLKTDKLVVTGKRARFELYKDVTGEPAARTCPPDGRPPFLSSSP